MKQRFFTNTIQSNFIKALVYNTPIPLLNTVNYNSYLLKDNIYIYKNNIIKCTKSGIMRMPEVAEGYTAYYRNGEILVVNDADMSEASGTGELNNFEEKLKNFVVLSPCKYSVISNYKFGRYYSKFTELYHSNVSYYDTTTHEHLGNLLRCYRDIYDLNLMPYYNCVSGDYISGIVIYKDRLKEENSDDYKTFKVPIKYNTTYTLALDCNYVTNIAPVLLSNNHTIDGVSYYSSSGSSETEELNSRLFEDNMYSFNSLSFKQPVTFGITTLNKDNASILQKYEKYLYLLIQVPKDNDSSIVLLEGDYTKVATNHIYNVEHINNLNNLELSELMTTNLSLLQMNNKISYPYANRLIEYLLLAVINHTDMITDDIVRAQKIFVNPKSVEGVWDNILRSNVYLNYQKNKYARQLDLNGFIDKDTEALIKKFN